LVFGQNYFVYTTNNSILYCWKDHVWRLHNYRNVIYGMAAHVNV